MAVIADIRTAADYVKQHVDIIAAIGSVVDLSRAGSDLYKGLCCFHEEGSPSLTVTPSKGLYHCFGCKASGDIISFYKQHYNLNAAEAIYEIAKDHGLDITQFERELTTEEKHRQVLHGVNIAVAKGMSSLLRQGSLQRGLVRGYDYLMDRGIGEGIMESFNLGYSPDVSHLLGLLAAAGVSDADATELLLDTDHAAMWTDSIVYPLHDPMGKVIGFKNRPYWDGQTVDNKGVKLAKFLGTSSKTPLHDEGHIYGLHIARRHLERGRLVLVEGQHDVLSAHGVEIRNVAGTDGTALNKEKLQALESFGVRELVILYDGDKAGRESSLKIAKATAEWDTSIAVKIASMPDGSDPDELIRSQGRMALLRVIHESVYASQYLIDQLAESMPLINVTQRIDFIKQVQPIISKAPRYEQVFLISYAAEKIKVDGSVIEDMIRTEAARGARSVLYNLEGEKIVLGGMFRDEDFRIEMILEIRKDDWYLPKHSMAYDIIATMHEAQVPISIETIKATMNNKGYNQVFAEGSYIDELYATIGDYRTIKDDLVDKAMRRKLERQADLMKQSVGDLRNRVILTVEEHYDAVQKITDAADTSTELRPQAGAKQFMDALLHRMTMPDQIVGIDLGPRFKSLTRLLGGVQGKTLITIAANQSVGKTTIVSNMIDEIAITQKQKWAHFTLEMPNEQMTRKIIGIRAGVDAQRIKLGNLTQEEYRLVQQATIEYHEGGLILIDDITTMEGIVNRTRKMIRQDGIVGISIDYIQLMRLERRGNMQKYQEEGEISGVLKNDIAKGMNVPVVILSQMSRRALDRDVQKAEDGQGAYKIAQDSDIYMILQEKSESEIEEWGIEKGNMTLNLDKNRDGQGDVLLDMLYTRDNQRMQEVR
jgi:DNA primase